MQLGPSKLTKASDHDVLRGVSGYNMFCCSEKSLVSQFDLKRKPVLSECGLVCVRSDFNYVVGHFHSTFPYVLATYQKQPPLSYKHNTPSKDST